MESQTLEKLYPEIYAQLQRLRDSLEEAYHQACEIDFVIESGRLYVLNVRPARMTTKAYARTALEFFADGRIDAEEALRQIPSDFVEQTLAPRIQSLTNCTWLANGLAASAGAAAGVAVLDEASALRYASSGKSVILIVSELSPGHFDALQVADGVLGSRGGLTSHAAEAARALGKPCVIGAGKVHVDRLNSRVTIGEHTIFPGTPIAIDGSSGDIYLGAPAIYQQYWWHDETARRVAALATSVITHGSSDDRLLLKCWRFHDAFEHHELRGFGLERAARSGSRMPETALSTKLADIHKRLIPSQGATADVACCALDSLIVGLGRVLRQKAGLGQHPIYFRPLWDPATSQTQATQLVGLEYFGINRLAPFWIDLSTVRVVLEISLADYDRPWKLDRTNPHGLSLAPGSLFVLAWGLWVNDAQIPDADLVSLCHFIRSREYSWKWFDSNEVTYDQLRQFLRGGPSPISRDFRLYQKCLQLGLINDNALSPAGESLVTEPEETLPAGRTTDDIVQRVTARTDEIIAAVIERGYTNRDILLDDYSDLVRRREFRDALITELYESHFSPDRHEFDYALIRELVESIATIPAVAYVAGAITAGVLGNAAYDVVKRVALAIATRFQERDPRRADLWRGIATDADRIEAFFEGRAIATAEQISEATGIPRHKLLPLLKLLGFTYDRGKGRNGWTPGPKRSAQIEASKK